ncbi:Hydroxypyruvate isomerase [Serratia rubidaea]|uniref:Hydroxypyruvate isomerase n=1 Tax=Serratia rubidaea TaxID=61652 RepID=A0A4V6JGS5_SERRU|nr:Hydroxypyruvate isomerase [Serratia rubidaea]
MPKFAANLSMMFTELPFLERFAAAADAGFKAVEYLFPYDYPADLLAEKLRRHGLQQVLFNTAPGDAAAGEWVWRRCRGVKPRRAPISIARWSMRWRWAAPACT